MTLLTERYALQIPAVESCYAAFAGALQTLRRGLRTTWLATSCRCSGGIASLPLVPGRSLGVREKIYPIQYAPRRALSRAVLHVSGGSLVLLIVVS
jgi:hypothetical protein